MNNGERIRLFWALALTALMPNLLVCVLGGWRVLGFQVVAFVVLWMAMRPRRQEDGHVSGN